MRASSEEIYQRLENDTKLTRAMGNFLLCTKQELFDALSLLKEEKTKGIITLKKERKKVQEEKELNYGYVHFKIPKKKKGEFREITIADNRIKQLQENLSLRLAKISLSTAAIGGER